MAENDDIPPPHEIDPATRREQFKLIYDYIKFHIGLYLATPAAIGLLGRSFGVDSQPAFQWSLAAMMFLYLIAGLHAGFFMGKHINRRWNSGSLEEFERDAFTLRRRVMHHWFYWFGLFAGIAGLVYAKLRC